MFCAPTGGIAFHQIHFAKLRVPLLTVREFARKRAALQSSFASCKLTGFPGRFTGLGGEHRFFNNFIGDARIFFKKSSEAFIDDRFYKSLDVAIAKLGLGLSFKLRIRHFTADDRDQPLTNIITRDTDIVF